MSIGTAKSFIGGSRNTQFLKKFKGDFGGDKMGI
jgi:hypothetical protein